MGQLEGWKVIFSSMGDAEPRVIKRPDYYCDTNSHSLSIHASPLLFSSAMCLLALSFPWIERGPSLSQFRERQKVHCARSFSPSPLHRGCYTGGPGRVEVVVEELAGAWKRTATITQTAQISSAYGNTLQRSPKRTLSPTVDKMSAQMLLRIMPWRMRVAFLCCDTVG